MAGATVNVAALEAPPPGAGLTTVTATLPAEARSAAPMLALSWVLLTNVVVRLLPPQSTVEFDNKLEPFTVSVKPRAPAGALLGEIEPTPGVGFGVGVGAGVGVGPGVSPELELHPTAATQRKTISVPAARLSSTLVFFGMRNSTESLLPPEEPALLLRTDRNALFFGVVVSVFSSQLSTIGTSPQVSPKLGTLRRATSVGSAVLFGLHGGSGRERDIANGMGCRCTLSLSFFVGCVLVWRRFEMVRCNFKLRQRPRTEQQTRQRDQP